MRSWIVDVICSYRVDAETAEEAEAAINQPDDCQADWVDVIVSPDEVDASSES